MEQFGLALSSIILIALGIAFVFIELESEEAEYFGPAAIFCLIVGTSLLFMSNPTSWLIAPEWFEIFAAVILTVVLVLIIFSVLIMYKITGLKNKPTKILEFVGEIGKAIDEISEKKEGFILFHGEHWKARSSENIEPGQKVKILKKEGLILIVEPVEEYNM